MEYLLLVAVSLIVAGLMTMIIGLKHKVMVTVGIIMVTMGGAGIGYMAVEEPPMGTEKQEFKSIKIA